MKKTLVILFLIAFGAVSLSAQDCSKAFNSTTITWFGLDFSKAKMIGAIGFTNPDKIVNYYFDAWNQLIIMESDKYNVKKFFKKNDVDNDLSVVSERNEEVSSDELVIEDSYDFTADDVKGIISQYNSDDDGVGLVFIIEDFNKLEEMGSIWVTFFDISSSKVLFTAKVSEEPGGWGFRNYWARCIYEVMKTSKKNLNKWEKDCK